TQTITATLTVEIFSKIYCGGAGVIHYQGKGFIAQENNLQKWTEEKTGTYDITSSMLDNQGYLHLIIQTSYMHGTPAMYFSLGYWSGSSLATIVSDLESITTLTDLQDAGSTWDYLYFTRDTITNNVRSEIQYSGTTVKTLSIDIPSVPHAKEIRVYTDLDYSSINPTATVTRVSDYW
ncbi:unnamed protein product, partial [marine sediment metagenome]